MVGLLAGLIALGAALEPEGMAEEIRQMNEDSAIAISTYLQGSFTDISRLRFAEWVEMLTYGNMMQGIGALSFFLFGFASVKLNTIARPSARVWRRCRHLYLPIGFLGSLWSAHLLLRADSLMDPNMMFSLFLLMLFSPFSTAGYLGLVAKWAERPVGQSKLFQHVVERHPSRLIFCRASSCRLFSAATALDFTASAAQRPVSQLASVPVCSP